MRRIYFCTLLLHLLLSVYVSVFLKVLFITFLSPGLISIHSAEHPWGAEGPHSFTGDILSQESSSAPNWFHPCQVWLRAVSSYHQTYLSAFSKVKARHEERGNIPLTRDIPELKNSRGTRKECATDRNPRLARSQTRNGSGTKVVFALTLEELKNKLFPHTPALFYVCEGKNCLCSPILRCEKARIFSSFSGPATHARCADTRASSCLLEEEDRAIYSSLPPRKEQWMMKTHGIFTT